MICRACHFEHNSWERCEISARKRVANGVANPIPVANNIRPEPPVESPSVSAVHIKHDGVRPTSTERSRKWRELNRETYKIRQRDLMRKKRAAKSA